MSISRLICFTVAMLLPIVGWSQAAGSGIEVDYNNPKTYIVGGVKVDGNRHFSQEQIIQVTGLREGKEITVPSEELSSIVKRLWLQRFFEDVSLQIDSLVPTRDTAFLKISIVERPRVSRWTFSGALFPFLTT